MLHCRGQSSFGDAVDSWYAEVNQYNFGSPGWSANTGHFTQLVWKDTTRVGCAYTTRCTWPTYICQYAPAGNVIGSDWSQEVKPAGNDNGDNTGGPGSSSIGAPPVPPAVSPNAPAAGSPPTAPPVATPASGNDSSLGGNTTPGSPSPAGQNQTSPGHTGISPSPPAKPTPVGGTLPTTLPPGNIATNNVTPPAGMNQPPLGHNPNYPTSIGSGQSPAGVRAPSPPPSRASPPPPANNAVPSPSPSPVSPPASSSGAQSPVGPSPGQPDLGRNPGNMPVYGASGAQGGLQSGTLRINYAHCIKYHLDV